MKKEGEYREKGRLKVGEERRGRGGEKWKNWRKEVMKEEIEKKEKLRRGKIMKKEEE